MQTRKPRQVSPYADRMGRFIGQLRVHENITLKQLARGLCEPGYLNKIENGEREVGKLLTDALFQRLGKPVELFERFLDHDEFVKWKQRQEIISYLRSGNATKALECAARYRTGELCVLEQQFLAIVEIDCHALNGMGAEKLLPLVVNALHMTQPDFGTVPFEELLLTQNEGRLLFACLRLREQLEGSEAVAWAYPKLMQYFKHPRYESRERVYLFPYVACRVVENEYREGNYFAALAVCEDALAELTREKRLYAYDELLTWKQTLMTAMGNSDRTPENLSKELTKLLERVPKRAELLVPCEEQGHVYWLNQVIRDRRALLNLSQEELSRNVCGLRSVSRVENEERKLHRKLRKELLQKVHMSGERYDYEIISERYEDYLLRSELDRAIIRKDRDRTMHLLSLLKEHVPLLPTNRQYLLKKELDIKAFLPEDDPRRWLPDRLGRRLEAIFRLTLPLDFRKVSLWPAGLLSVNETLLLMMRAVCHMRQQRYQEGLDLLLFVKKCLECGAANDSYHGDLHMRLGIHLSSALNSVGRYAEAEQTAREFMQCSLENRSSSQLARYAYIVACNIEAQLPKLHGIERVRKQKEALALHRQAYAAAVISNDMQGEKSIQAHCERLYGKDFSLES